MTEVVKATGITKTFGSGDAGVRAIDNVDLSIASHELVLIMGPSGSGKTTLLTILGGLLRPDAGSVIIDGVDITDLNPGDLAALRRTKIGFVFQSFHLWESLSVIENVELVLNIAGVGGQRARQRARTLLEERGLGNRLRFRARNLSGGEKQRVSIARALANEPRLLLADEPTANLDSKRGHEIMLLLRDIARSGERAVVVVSHDQRIREVADRVLWLEDGHLKQMSDLVRDPVCGMALEADAAVQTGFEGRTFYFCSQGCSAEFRARPGAFIGMAVPADAGKERN
jgi:putative ABC transport system ATP-binding protein